MSGKIDRIRALLPLTDFLKEHGVPHISDLNWKCFIKSHDSNKPVAVHNNKFKCWGCKVEGDVIDAYTHINECDRDYAIAELAQLLHIEEDTTELLPPPNFAELNYYWDTELDKKGEPVEVKSPLAWNQAIDNLLRMGQDRLFTLTGTMFALPDVPGDEPILLPRNSHMFEFLASSNEVSLDWCRKDNCISKDEAYAGVLRKSDSYISVEQVPHVPKMRDRLYNHPPLPMPQSSILEEFLDFFCPETEYDRFLLKALFATSVWGGFEGSRPMFVITSKDGQGVGKSKVAIILGELIGGYISSDTKKDIEDLKTRLLTAEARCKRMVFLDNEVGEVSSGEIASLITEKTISGRQLYKGEGSRPNTLMWVMTLNTPQLDRDLSTRSVPISLKRFEKEKSKTWESDIFAFIDEHRWTIISCLAEICEIGQDYSYEPFSRFPLWESSVLAHCCPTSEWETLQKTIISSRERFNVEDEAVIDFVSEFKYMLLNQVEDFTAVIKPQKDPAYYRIIIHNTAIWEIAKNITGLNGLGKITATRKFRDYVEKDLFDGQLLEYRDKHIRGFEWTGARCRPDAAVDAHWKLRDDGLIRPPDHDLADDSGLLPF